MTRRVLLTSLLALLGLSLLSPVGPPAQAQPAPWTWKTAVTAGTLGPGEAGGIAAHCPAGYTPITGGYHVTTGGSSGLYRMAESPDRPNHSWWIELHNRSNVTKTVDVHVHCILESQLPPIEAHTATAVNSGGLGWAEAMAHCAAGQRVLDGDAYWSPSGFDRNVRTYIPKSDGTGWYANGYHELNDGAELTVTAYCVNTADLPGFTMVEQVVDQNASWTRTVQCPAGTRVLGGGMTGGGDGHTLDSWPSDPTRWTFVGLDGGFVLRVMCVAAGTPTVALTSTSPGPPGAVVADDFARFQFEGSDPAGYSVQFVCQVDDGAGQVCTSPFQTAALADGHHRFVVRSFTTDMRSSVNQVYTWTIDTTPPMVAITKQPPVVLPGTASATYAGTDATIGVKEYRVQYQSASLTSGFGAWQAPAAWNPTTATTVSRSLALGATVCFRVSAYDWLDHASAPVVRCTARPVDDRALRTATSGWTRTSNSAYWLGTATHTSRQNARLVLNGTLTASRLGLVATTCRTCGRVGVFVGSTKVGEISLVSNTVRHRQVKLLPPITPRTGTVSLKVLTSGKLVRIDGLVSSRHPLVSAVT